MLDVLIWWIALDIVALLALPLAMRMLRFLPDTGLGLIRQVGLVVVGYLFWLLVTLHVLPNTVPAIVAVMLLVGGLSFWTWRQHGEWLWERIQDNLRSWLAIELLFAAAYLGFCVFRAFNPDIAATEKPMEYAFVNGILGSRTFPPKDPWLAGYGISYYYFGYVMMSILTKLTGIGSNVTFNLTGATLFALTVTGSYSLVRNMVLSSGKESQAAEDSPRVKRAGWFGALAAFFVAMMGNLEGIFELIRARGWGSAALFAWLDVKNLGVTAVSSRWYPDDMWWWWRASRVIHDKNALGQSVEVIDEFPFFSFLLGDNHPHVLALPFVLLALSIALNLLVARRDKARPPESQQGIIEKATCYVAGLWSGPVTDWIMWAVCLGALGFLNTWDLPIYWGICVLAYAIWRHGPERSSRDWLVDTVLFSGILLASSVLLYLLFYVGFRSQAGGIAPVGATKTRLLQYMLMMGTFVVAMLGLLGTGTAKWLRTDAAARRLPLLAQALGVLLAMGALFSLVQGWWTAALLLGMMALGSALAIWGSVRREGAAPLSKGEQFALVLAVCGLLLTVSVEFIFLKDTFNSRMNTVFKFYYQAWVLMGLSAAYAVYALVDRWSSARVPARVGLGIGLALVAVLALCGGTYTVMASVSKAGGFAGEPTLDGARYIEQYRPDDAAAIAWLNEHAVDDAVMLEASGGSYSEYNWVSAATGIPTLLGWGGHELQWRGNYDVPGAREPDIATIYQSMDVAETRQLLDKYGIDYVYLGRLETQKYGVSQPAVTKFERLMVPVYQNASVTIYGWPRPGVVQ